MDVVTKNVTTHNVYSMEGTVKKIFNHASECPFHGLLFFKDHDLIKYFPLIKYLLITLSN